MVMLPQEYLNNVVAIGTEKKEWYGTGFFYAYMIDDDKYLPFLVTNQHVIDAQIKEGKHVICLKSNSKKDNSVKIGTLNLYDNKGNPTFFSHPYSDVDLAIIPVDSNAVSKKLEIGFFSSQMSCTKDKMEEIGVSEGEFIYVLGFPMVNIDINYSSVIVRSGSIARIRDIYQDKSKSFLLDSYIFPGNSGGPVFIKPQIAAMGASPINQSYLIGVVKEYLTYSEIAESRERGGARVVFTENSGLSLAHPMDYVHEIIKMVRNKHSI